MRRVVAAAALAVLAASFTPPAGAQSPGELPCPRIGQTTLFGTDHGIESYGTTFSRGCVYSADDYDAGHIGVKWVEGSYGTCPIETARESTSDQGGFGVIVSDTHAVSADYRWASWNSAAPTREQMKAAAESLIAQVEPRAAPCGTPPPATITPTTTPSVGASPSATSDAPVCAVEGTVYDDRSLPIEFIHLKLTGLLFEMEGSTDARGRFAFTGISDAHPEVVPGDEVTITMALEEKGQKQRYRFFHQGTVAELTTKPLELTDASVCRADISGTNHPVMVPSSPHKWRSLYEMRRQLVRSMYLAESVLKETLPYSPPLNVQAWCTDSALRCTEDTGAHALVSASTGYVEPQPTLAVFPKSSDEIADYKGNTIHHEFGHYFQSIAFGGLPIHPGRKPHRGYYENDSSSDAWIEGFATFYAGMARKHVELSSPGYRYREGQETFFEIDYKPWGGSPLSEEDAVTSLLIDLEDGSSDYPDAGSELVSDVRFRDLKTPDGNHVIVGRIPRTRVDQLARVLVQFVDDRGKVVHHEKMWVDTSAADRRQRGVFWTAAPVGLRYASVRANARVGKSGDDDPIDLDVAALWASIDGARDATSKPGKANGYDRLYDVHELYGALKKVYGGKDDDGDGRDDLDQVFVAHGFHADPDGNHSFDDGETVGMSTRPQPGATTPPAPRHDPPTVPATLAQLDTGGVDATAIAFVSYDAPYETHSYSYALEPLDGTVALAVPPEDVGGSVTVLTLAEGHLPEVAGTVRAESFWKEARSRDYEPFLAFDVDLREGDVTLDEGGPPALAFVLVGLGLIAAAAGLFLGRSGNSMSPSLRRGESR